MEAVGGDAGGSFGSQQRRRRRCKPGVRAAKERQVLRRTTGTILQRVPFRSLVHRVCRDVSRDKVRFTREAMVMLQVFVESRMQKMYTIASRIASHAGRQTTMGSDFLLGDLNGANLLDGVDV